MKDEFNQLKQALMELEFFPPKNTYFVWNGIDMNPVWYKVDDFKSIEEFIENTGAMTLEEAKNFLYSELSRYPDETIRVRAKIELNFELKWNEGKSGLFDTRRYIVDNLNRNSELMLYPYEVKLFDTDYLE